jgi:hypothetical protein
LWKRIFLFFFTRFPMMCLHLGLKIRIGRSFHFCKMEEFCDQPSLMIIMVRSSRAPHHSLLTKGEASLYMTATNQILSWIFRISKNRLQSHILCSLMNNIMRKSSILGLRKMVSSRLKRRDFPRVFFMMIMNLTLGKAMKKNQRSNRRGDLSPI